MRNKAPFLGLWLLLASTAAARPIGRGAAEQAVLSHPAFQSKIVTVSDPKPLDVGPVLLAHGVVSDVEVRTVAPPAEGKAAPGIAKLWHPAHTVVIGPRGDDGAELLAHRRGAEAPALSSRPKLGYAWSQAKRSALVKGTVVFDFAQDVGSVVALALVPHLAAPLAIAKGIGWAVDGAAYGTAIWRNTSTLSAQREAVAETVGHLEARSAAGAETDFSELYAHYRSAAAGKKIDSAEWLDALQLRDWVSQALSKTK